MNVMYWSATKFQLMNVIEGDWILQMIEGID